MDSELQKRVREALLVSYKNSALQKVKQPKRKTQGETKVRDACEELVRLWGCFVWVNRTGKREIEGRWLSWGYPGSADLLGCTPRGKFLAIETKSTTKQQENQIRFQAAVEKRGGIYVLAYSVDDVIARQAEILA